MIYGLRDQHIRRGARLGGVWVDAAHRRGGAGRLLVDGIVSWARERGYVAARLWVGKQETAAIALHERAGFRFTGVERALEDRPSIAICEMHCPL
jgi:GNAT superfamily N-acetyltransferase